MQNLFNSYRVLFLSIICIYLFLFSSCKYFSSSNNSECLNYENENTIIIALVDLSGSFNKKNYLFGQKRVNLFDQSINNIKNEVIPNVLGGDCLYIFGIYGKNTLSNSHISTLSLCSGNFVVEKPLVNSTGKVNYYEKKINNKKQCELNFKNADTISAVKTQVAKDLEQFRLRNSSKGRSFTDLYGSIKVAGEIFNDYDDFRKELIIYSDLEDDINDNISEISGLSLTGVNVECRFFTSNNREANNNMANTANKLKNKIKCDNVNIIPAPKLLVHQ